jgi:uracil-DNA glycosylase
MEEKMAERIRKVVCLLVVSLFLIIPSLYSEEDLSGVNIGSFTATHTPLTIQVCKDGEHKGAFSIVKGTNTLYYGKAFGKNKDDIYFYVPIELKITYTDREIWGIRMQDRYIEPSPYCFAISKEETGSLVSREMTDRSVAAETSLKPGKDLKFSITSGFQTYLINRTISKRFKKLLTGEPGPSNEAKLYFLIAPREDFEIDKIEEKEITTMINLVLYIYHPATRLRAKVRPTNKANDLVIEIKTKLVNEKTFLKNLPK